MSKVTTIGLGGCGLSIVSDLKTNKNFDGFEFKAIDTNNLQLEFSSLDKKNTLQLGNGLGSGMNPNLALQLAQKKEKDGGLTDFLKKPEILILIAGVGGTGAGTVDYIANLAIKQGSLPVVFLVKPADNEDKQLQFNSLVDQLNLKKYSYSIISNQLINKEFQDLPADEVFKKPNEVLEKCLNSILNLQNSKSGIDFNDVKTILNYKGLFLANTVKGKDWQECFTTVADPHLLEHNLNSFEGGIIKISAKNFPSQKEIDKALENLLKFKKPQTKFKLGYEKLSPNNPDNQTQVDLILTGINNNNNL